MDISGTPAEFRQNAYKCVELASNTKNAVHRQALLSLAIKWLHLAGARQHEIDLIGSTDERSVA
jgi:hypothetical protein